MRVTPRVLKAIGCGVVVCLIHLSAPNNPLHASTAKKGLLAPPADMTVQSVSATYDVIRDQSRLIRVDRDLQKPSVSEAISVTGGASGNATGLPQGWSTIMSETFEGIFPNSAWVVSGDPTWDDQYCLCYGGSWSAWCANGGASGVEPCPGTVDYVNNMDAWMIYGPFDLSKATDARMTFQLSTVTEMDFDWCAWMASPDGNNWFGTQVSGNTSGWIPRVMSLAGSVGDPSVWIAFRFTSDGSVVFTGSYVDDIVIEQYVQPDLECYAHYAWPGPIIVTCRQNDLTQCSPGIIAGHPAYIHWAAINSGGETTAQTFLSRLRVISGPGAPFEIGQWSTAAPFDPRSTASVYNYAYVFPVTGTYTLELCNDHTSVIPESNEANNCCQYTFVVSLCNCPRQGDINGDTFIDVFDVIDLIGIAFSGGVDTQDRGCPKTRADVNNDGASDVFDVIYLIATAFSEGPMPINPCGP